MLKADEEGGPVMECGENPLVTFRIAPRLITILSYLIEVLRPQTVMI